jgi:hypothetical protein
VVPISNGVTDMTRMTKPELNALLPTPLTASALKKTSKADLVAMIESAQPAAIVDDSEYLTPTPTTDFEKRVLVAHLGAGIDCNGADTLEAMLSDNMTFADVAEVSQRTGLTKNQVKGVIVSLASKYLLSPNNEKPNGAPGVDQVLTDDGLRVAFNLLANGVEAHAPKPAPKAKAKAATTPKALKPHVYCEPGKLDDVKAVKAGSKRHLLFAALKKGATLEEMMAATGWNRSTVQSSFRVDVPAAGFGCERRADGCYWLLLPKGLKSLPVAQPGQTRAEAVAGCR